METVNLYTTDDTYNADWYEIIEQPTTEDKNPPIWF